MGYISTWMGDRLSALLMSLMAVRLMLVDRNPFRACYITGRLVKGYQDMKVCLYIKYIYIYKVKVGVLRPVQQPGSYWDRSSDLPLVGLEPTEVTAHD